MKARQPQDRLHHLLRSSQCLAVVQYLRGFLSSFSLYPPGLVCLPFLGHACPQGQVHGPVGTHAAYAANSSMPQYPDIRLLQMGLRKTAQSTAVLAYISQVWSGTPGKTRPQVQSNCPLCSTCSPASPGQSCTCWPAAIQTWCHFLRSE